MNCAEQGLNDAGIGAAFEEVVAKLCGECGVTRCRAAAGPGIAAGGLHGAGGEMEVRAPGGKSQDRRDGECGSKHGGFRGGRGEHGVTVLAPCRIDAIEHALAIDAGELRATLRRCGGRIRSR